MAHMQLLYLCHNLQLSYLYTNIYQKNINATKIEINYRRKKCYCDDIAGAQNQDIGIHNHKQLTGIVCSRGVSMAFLYRPTVSKYQFGMNHTFLFHTPTSASHKRS